MNTIAYEPRRFRSTAEFYARYRIPYPATLIESVAARVGLTPGDAVLDLGCGPGILGLAFARLGMRVTAMDPEPEMLEATRDAAADAGLDIAVRHGSSYDLDATLGTFCLVVMGRSFHWMDRPATLALLDRLIEPGGAVGLFHDRQIVTTPAWSTTFEAVAERFSPERGQGRRSRRAGWVPHEVMLLGSAFSAVEMLSRISARDLTIDDLVGRAYSMSVTSPEALGDRQAEFEAALRAELLALAPDGRLNETVAVDAILAFRPDSWAELQPPFRRGGA